MASNEIWKTSNKWWSNIRNRGWVAASCGIVVIVVPFIKDNIKDKIQAADLLENNAKLVESIKTETWIQIKEALWSNPDSTLQVLLGNNEQSRKLLENKIDSRIVKDEPYLIVHCGFLNSTESNDTLKFDFGMENLGGSIAKGVSASWRQIAFKDGNEIIFPNGVERELFDGNISIPANVPLIMENNGIVYSKLKLLDSIFVKVKANYRNSAGRRIVYQDILVFVRKPEGWYCAYYPVKNNFYLNEYIKKIGFRVIK